MKITLGFSGGDELAARLRLLSTAVRKKALTRVLREAAWPIQSRAAQLAPIDPATNLHLKDWMAVSTATKIGSVAGGRWDPADEFQAAVAIGPSRSTFWGIYVEYGTVKMAAQPFLRPAFDYGFDRTLSIIREGLWALLDDANNQAGAFSEDQA